MSNAMRASIAACMQRSGFSQQRIADEIDVERSLLSQIVNGYSDPSVATLEKIAAATGHTLLLMDGRVAEAASALSVLDQTKFDLAVRAAAAIAELDDQVDLLYGVETLERAAARRRKH